MTEKEKIREYLAKYADDVMCDYATSRDIKGVILPFIDSMQEEPKECMYSKDNYTDEDRKVLCDGCEEDCKLNKKLLKKIEQRSWSEEDIIIRNALIKLVEMLYESSIYKSDKIRLLDWLKSLRPQSTWKPSAEQIKALNLLLLKGEITEIGQAPCLQTLYNDLKAL